MGRRLPSTIAVVAMCAVVLLPAASRASTSKEADFVSRLNGERDARGIPSLVVKSDLTAVARDWSERMAAAGSISHDPDLAQKVSGWTMLGDNVGKGSTVSSIHKAFMNSDTHRHIILEEGFNQVGVGVVMKGSTIYVTQVFARRAGGYAPSPKAPAASHAGSAPAAAPAPAVFALTSEIWSVQLTAEPVTVDLLMELIELDAAYS